MAVLAAAAVAAGGRYLVRDDCAHAGRNTLRMQAAASADTHGSFSALARKAKWRVVQHHLRRPWGSGARRKAYSQAQWNMRDHGLSGVRASARTGSWCRPCSAAAAGQLGARHDARACRWQHLHQACVVLYAFVSFLYVGSQGVRVGCTAKGVHTYSASSLVAHVELVDCK